MGRNTQVTCKSTGPVAEGTTTATSSMESPRKKMKLSQPAILFDVADCLTNAASSTDISEVTFVCSDHVEVKVYKELLKYCSPYFKNLFDDEWSILHPDGKFVTRFDGQLINVIVDYMYHRSDDKEYDCNFCIQLYKAAVEFELEHFQKLVLSPTLASFLAVKDAKELVQLAFLYNDKGLKKQCLKYVQKNKYDLLLEPLFVALYKEDLSLWGTIVDAMYEGHRNG